MNTILIYCREAHPGEKRPHHTSFEFKLQVANEFKNSYAQNRIVLVDSLEGESHLALGGLNSMVYIVNHRGTIMFRSNRADGILVGQYLEMALQNKGERRRTLTAEMCLEIDWDFEEYIKLLNSAGPQAVKDFIRHALDQSKTSKNRE
ncbi:hypothetical protein M3647_05540 [Paenibacillus cellulositrophicus]|uniref:hypothetical protein n=1 Tax=Paenibacillus cellulositrophicus TaxID=562959 RepID=UPI00203A4BEC|nr:hypothetical protein [Paenibacillus cellulositrophicus]